MYLTTLNFELHFECKDVGRDVLSKVSFQGNFGSSHSLMDLSIHTRSPPGTALLSRPLWLLFPLNYSVQLRVSSKGVWHTSMCWVCLNERLPGAGSHRSGGCTGSLTPSRTSHEAAVGTDALSLCLSLSVQFSPASPRSQACPVREKTVSIASPMTCVTVMG